jgi:hypothetical protein
MGKHDNLRAVLPQVPQVRKKRKSPPHLSTLLFPAIFKETMPDANAAGFHRCGFSATKKNHR